MRMFWQSADPWDPPPTPSTRQQQLLDDTAFDLPAVIDLPHDEAPPTWPRSGLELMARVKYWYGPKTRRWWAFVPGTARQPDRLLEGRTEAGLHADVARLCRTTGSAR